MGTNITTYDSFEIIPDNVLTISSKQEFFEFNIKKSDVKTIITLGNIKDYLYNEAIVNLMKKSKFLQLYIQLIEDQISEEEYDKELNDNSNEYFINMKELNPGLDYAALLLVLHNLPKNMTFDEVSEVFGIKTQSLMRNFNF
jgi:hypothetical protein